ncbi:efflux transporter outer membrane subunit [Winogradskyella helgolandensis]|uniref:efflux transporter outer membrane subunit n=1 Tax=Winogradskyella helgolandensis TaxID=2697010 RepID=UPI0015BCFF35|nr:efflux transporter outer membrane subunit [Winogradskyella helgolandensis]
MTSIIKHRNFSKGALLLIVAITLQSCFVAQDYVRPELDSETEALYRTDNLPTDSVSMADVSWKNLFTDQYLQQYIEEGLQNNMDVRIALQQMLAAEAYAKQGKSGYLPTASIGANATHQELSENSQFGALFSGGIDTYDITANLAWEADIWGKIRSNKRATQAGYLQSVAEHQLIKTQLVSSIANTYYNLLALDAQLEVTKQTIATRESGVNTIKALKEAGQVTQVAVDQNIAQYNSARALQVDIETAIFKTENTLSILLGKSSQHFERSSLDIQKIDEGIKLGLPATLLSNRPDVMAAEYGLIESFELTNVANSSFYPSLTLSASGGLQSLELDKLFNANSLFATVIGGLTQPILNNRKLKTQKEVALANQEASLLNFKKTLLVAGNEVSDALYSYEAEMKKYEFRKNEVEALRTAEANSEELLKNGYANYLDLLTARQSALSAELNIIDSQLQQLVSIVDLYEALGGGWK